MLDKAQMLGLTAPEDGLVGGLRSLEQAQADMVFLPKIKMNYLMTISELY